MSLAAVAEPRLELEQNALSLADQAKALRITDQATFEQAGEFVKSIVAMRQEIIDHHEPMRKRTHEAYQSVLQAKATLLKPVEEAEAVVKRAISDYVLQQQRILAERERQAREEAERVAAEAIEAAAVEAESQGASVAEVRAIIEQPLVVPQVPVAPTIQRVQGVGTTTIWRAQVTSMRDLCRAIADGRVPESYVAPNMTALNARARADKQAMSLPGVRAVPEANVRVGGR